METKHKQTLRITGESTTLQVRYAYGIRAKRTKYILPQLVGVRLNPHGPTNPNAMQVRYAYYKHSINNTVVLGTLDSF